MSEQPTTVGVEARTYWIYPEKVFVTYWVGDESHHKVFDSDTEFKTWLADTFGPPVSGTSYYNKLG